MKSIITIIIIAVILIGGWSLMKSDKTEQSNTNQEAVATSSNATSTSSYTIAEIALHNKAGDCWTTINGKVYDLTTWPDKHPGGSEAILSLCGINGSEAFNKKHGGQENPEATLEGFYIGELAE